MKLTKATAERLNLPQGKTEMIVFDETLAGFGLRIRAGGKRTWIAQYRVGSKQRRITIGTVETLDADEARQRAKRTLSKVHLGGDPQLEKSEARARAALTLGATVERYLTERAQARLKPRSYQEIERHLRKHWGLLANLPLKDVERADVAAQLTKIAKASGPIAANRARAALSSLFAWALGEGLADTNPVIGSNKPANEIARDRVLTDEELRLIWRHAGDGGYGDIVRLLTLTGQRREEVAAMLWSELDLANGLWRISSERTKNGLAHDVPLSNAALGILQARDRQAGRDLVFGTSGPFSGWSKAKASLDSRLAVANGRALAPWRLHDIRRTAATRLADLGVLPHVVEAILNHVSGHKAGVAGIYNRSSYAAEKREALRLWGEHIAAIVAVGE